MTKFSNRSTKDHYVTHFETVEVFLIYSCGEYMKYISDMSFVERYIYICLRFAVLFTYICARVTI